MRLLILFGVALSSAWAQGLDPAVHFEARDTAGRTPLFAAVAAGQMEAVRVLLVFGANVNAMDSAGRTSLIEAADQGRMDIAQALVKGGADLNISQRGAGTALEAAERTGHTELAAMLRKVGAQTSGRSVGDKVCVRPWGGDGYCGIVEDVAKAAYRIHVTEIAGCENGCAPTAECSAGKPVGGVGGLRAGDTITTVSWCLTHTGVAK